MLTVPTTALGPDDPDDGDAGREARGQAIAAIDHIEQEGRVYSVPSQSGRGHYTVRIDGDNSTCSCPDFKARGRPCKHLIATHFVKLRDLRNRERIKPQSTRPWPLYHRAQEFEQERFFPLLAGLCRGIPEPEYEGGRPGILLADKVFGIVHRVYGGASGRRSMTSLRACKSAKLISKVPSPTAIGRTLDDQATARILEWLILQSALPLGAVERTFAADSTGFSTSVYDRWFDHKWGKRRKEARFVKVHMMCGVRSKIITAALAHATNTSDGAQLPSLLDTTAANFQVDEVLGDKAYLSRKNLQAIIDAGADAYIPFKSNSVAHDPKHNRPQDGTWSRLYHFFHYSRDKFDAHYHKRSNAETVFSMVKAKFGHAVRSRKAAAQVNEALAKLVAHNICVVIQAMYQTGLTPEFKPFVGQDD